MANIYTPVEKPKDAVLHTEPPMWNIILLDNDESVSGLFVCLVVRTVLKCGHLASHKLMDEAETYGRAVMLTTSKELAETLFALIQEMHKHATPMIDYRGFGNCPVLFTIEQVGA